MTCWQKEPADKKTALDTEELRQRLLVEVYAGALTGLSAMILEESEIRQADAEELMEILSAHSRKSTRKSSTVRIPPPTVKGKNTFAATSRTRSTTVFL